jgi:hypothetical protein
VVGGKDGTGSSRGLEGGGELEEKKGKSNATLTNTSEARFFSLSALSFYLHPLNMFLSAKYF